MITHPSPLLARSIPVDLTPPRLPQPRRTCTRRMCLPEHFAAAAEQAPDALALKSGDARMSYGELDARSNQLAAYLRPFGVGREVAVALNLERSFDYVIAALAAWKAGGAYLPLDPSWPLERREQIIQQAGASLLITRGECAIKARYLINLDLDSAAIAREQPVLIPLVTRRENLACIVYDEKSRAGIEWTHGNLLNLVFWHCRAFEVTSADRAAQLARVSSGTAAWEIWPYLVSGASVHLAEGEPLSGWIARDGITIARLSFEDLQTLGAEGHALRIVFTEEALESEDASFKLVTIFGAPECTVVACAQERVANTYFHLLDKKGSPVEPGTPGELYIGGAGVARGYRGRRDLTAEFFPHDPFCPEARLYRTGETARLLSTGRIVLHSDI